MIHRSSIRDWCRVDHPIREWVARTANVGIRGRDIPFANGAAYSRMGIIRGWCGTYISQLFAAESTTATIQHLTKFHKVKRPANSTNDDENTQTDYPLEVFQLAISFNEDKYKQKLINWVIKLYLIYREVTDEATIDILTNGKPSLTRLLPTHHSTLS